MMQPEYLELPEATDPTCSFRVSVTLQGGAMICKRDICLPSFLKLMSGQQYERPFFPIDTVFYVRPFVPLTFCFYALEQIGLGHMNTDAAVPGLNRNNVYRLEVAWPGAAIVDAFDAVVSAMRAKIKQNDDESRTLAQTRDLLLPRLMSGELRVAD